MEFRRKSRRGRAPAFRKRTSLRSDALFWVVSGPPRVAESEPDTPHFMVGMTKSAPARIPVGQRLVMVLRRV